MKKVDIIDKKHPSKELKAADRCLAGLVKWLAF